MALIRGLRLSGFFLLHQDMLVLAREVALEVRGPESARRLLPPGRGRGSIAGSAMPVSYGALLAGAGVGVAGGAGVSTGGAIPQAVNSRASSNGLARNSITGEDGSHQKTRRV